MARVITGIYHVNVNCADLGRSLAFYEKLGFRVVAEFEERDNPGLNKGLGLPDSHTQALFLKAGRGRDATLIDLVRWHQPVSPPKRENDIAALGVPRIALKAENLRQLYEDLKAEGVEFISEPQQLAFPEFGTEPLFCVCRDPDGLLIELVEV